MRRDRLQIEDKPTPLGRLPRLDRLRAPVLPGFRTLGPGSVSSLLKIAVDVAYVLLMVITGILLLAFLACFFVPIENFTVTSGESERAVPLTRALLLFGVGSFAAYFGSFLLVLGNLRRVFRTLIQGDPFQPANVRRLQQVGLILATVTGGVWLWHRVVDAALAPGVLEAPSLGDLLTPIFATLVVFVLAEVFREGARLRRESELTI